MKRKTVKQLFIILFKTNIFASSNIGFNTLCLVNFYWKTVNAHFKVIKILLQNLKI